MLRKIDISYHIESISFQPIATDPTGNALVEGFAIFEQQKIHFTFVITSDEDGGWILGNLIWEMDIDILYARELVQALADKVALLLSPINMWPNNQIVNGATLSVNAIKLPIEHADSVIVSVRPNMLSLPSPAWDSLWYRILSRIRYDPCFKVHGFNENDVDKAATQLRVIFPNGWVRRRYQTALGGKSNTVGMDVDYPPGDEFWFPSYHLARTALGAICIDPGWNYLIDIGLSLSELSGFPEIIRLKNQLARNPGSQHQLCFAAELYNRGYLIGLEPNTGSGNAKNDLLIKCNGHEYDIEVKALSSENPRQKIMAEIKEKMKRLPKLPVRPIVFHVVLVEHGLFDNRKAEVFFQELREIENEIPRGISAVVGGRVFVDSSGGRVKRDMQVCVINPKSYISAIKQDLEELFESNYRSIVFPMFGIGTFIHYGESAV